MREKAQSNRQTNSTMQSYICVSIITASLVLMYTHVEASTGAKLVPPHPDHPGKCYDDETNAAYGVGETWSKTGSCVRYECKTGPENNFLIEINGCSPVAAGPPCRVVSGNTAEPYPKCCNTVVCD